MNLDSFSPREQIVAENLLSYLYRCGYRDGDAFPYRLVLGYIVRNPKDQNDINKILPRLFPDE